MSVSSTAVYSLFFLSSISIWTWQSDGYTDRFFSPSLHLVRSGTEGFQWHLPTILFFTPPTGLPLFASVGGRLFHQLVWIQHKNKAPAEARWDECCYGVQVVVVVAERWTVTEWSISTSSSCAHTTAQHCVFMFHCMQNQRMSKFKTLFRRVAF